MRVLVYGDSNSWGILADGGGLRCARRWPVVMAGVLGCEIVEDCVPGRTSVHDDDAMAAETGTNPGAFNGMAHIEASLLAASPVDRMLIMLGTNDMKTRFAPSADKIAGNIAALAKKAGSLPVGPGPWVDGPVPKIGVICPPHLGALARDASWERLSDWEGGPAASEGLHGALKSRLPGSVALLDGNDHSRGSPLDPIHFEPEEHERLGLAVADWMGRW